MKDIACPRTLQGYQTYQVRGLAAGADRDAEPRVRSMRRSPRTRRTKYIYFLAIPDGGGKHASPRPRHSTRRTSRSTATLMAGARRRWPSPADFAPPPSPEQLAAWERRTGPPGRPASPRLRARFAEAGVDAYFGVRREHMRYLTGFTLAEGEEKVAGQLRAVPGRAATRSSSSPTRATRSRQRREAPDARDRRGVPRPARRAGRTSLASVGARRVAVEAGVRRARACGAPRGGRAGRGARAGRGLGRGRSRGEGARPSSSGSPRPAPSPTGARGAAARRSGRA